MSEVDTNNSVGRTTGVLDRGTVSSVDHEESVVHFGGVESEIMGRLEGLESGKLLSLLFLGFASLGGIGDYLYPRQERWAGDVWGPWCSMGGEGVGTFGVGSVVSRDILELGEFLFVADFVRVERDASGRGYCLQTAHLVSRR